MNVYLAGSSAKSERARLRRLFAALGERPWVTLTFNWLEAIEEVERLSRPITADIIRKQAAMRCAGGVSAANRVWFALPPPDVKTEGGFWELGYAYGVVGHAGVLISTPDGTPYPGSTRIFHLLFDGVVSDDAALKAIDQHGLA